MIIFISGLSGTGKSSLVSYFKKNSLTGWEFFDFDKGLEPVPHDESEHFAWRKRQTDYWLSLAERNGKKNINTVIIGLGLYPRDTKELEGARDIDLATIRYAYITCSPQERKRRLLAQGADHRWRENNPWHDEFLSVMKNECEKEFDTSDKSIEQVAVEIIEWLESLYSGLCKECGRPLTNSQFFGAAACRNYPFCKSAEKEIGSALSYLMGADDIKDKDIEDIGAIIKGKTVSGSRKLEILKSNLPAYIVLVKSKLSNGFWNEIVTDDKIIFTFKHNDGSVMVSELNLNNEQEIAQLCHEFNDEPSNKTSNVYKYLSENDFYHDFMMKHYADMINR